ncbi:unnamed protein product [Rotaria sp. Silwood1]|nr:unnamed protein product [Rotaria sp. Silwood1]
MTKAVGRAMDAIQQLLQQKNIVVREEFVIGGVSKRGWTTYLDQNSKTKIFQVQGADDEFFLLDNADFFWNDLQVAADESYLRRDFRQAKRDQTYANVVANPIIWTNTTGQFGSTVSYSLIVPIPTGGYWTAALLQASFSGLEGTTLTLTTETLILQNTYPAKECYDQECYGRLVQFNVQTFKIDICFMR